MGYRLGFCALGLIALAGCNVVPPLDCLMGASRDGCQRDADGNYKYIATAPVENTPQANPYYIAPWVPPPAPPPVPSVTTSCTNDYPGHATCQSN